MQREVRKGVWAAGVQGYSLESLALFLSSLLLNAGQRLPALVEPHPVTFSLRTHFRFLVILWQYQATPPWHSEGHSKASHQHVGRLAAWSPGSMLLLSVSLQHLPLIQALQQTAITLACTCPLIRCLPEGMALPVLPQTHGPADSLFTVLFLSAN